MTRTRRVNGEGTYYVDSKKGLASWRRNYIDRFGCKKRKSIYAKSKLELKPLIKKWEEELARNILPEDENLTVKDWLDIWLERFIKPNTKIRTYDNYNSCIDQYLKPQFGKEKLKKLTPLKIVVRHINLGSIRHFKLVENNIKQFAKHINLCFFCALF